MPGVPHRYDTVTRAGDKETGQSEQPSREPGHPPPPAARVRNTTSILLPSSLGAADHSSQQARDGRRRIGLAYKRRARHRRRRTQGAPVPRGARPDALVGAKPAGIGRGACEGRSRESPARL